MTKAELEDALTGVEDLVDEALDPELTREELVAKVKAISELVSGDEDDDDDDDPNSEESEEN